MLRTCFCNTKSKLHITRSFLYNLQTRRVITHRWWSTGILPKFLWVSRSSYRQRLSWIRPRPVSRFRNPIFRKFRHRWAPSACTRSWIVFWTTPKWGRREDSNCPATVCRWLYTSWKRLFSPFHSRRACLVTIYNI